VRGGGQGKKVSCMTRGCPVVNSASWATQRREAGGVGSGRGWGLASTACKYDGNKVAGDAIIMMAATASFDEESEGCALCAIQRAGLLRAPITTAIRR
jgi:hypothetical protein